MTKQEQLKKSIDSMNKHSGGSSYNEWVLFLLTSIADSMATIADSLSEEVE